MRVVFRDAIEEQVSRSQNYIILCNCVYVNKATHRKSQPPACCPPKPALATRKLITSPQAVELAALFKLLGNETRVRLVHALVRSGEMSVTKLADTVGMKPQAVSNQLQRLSDRGVVASRRAGANIHYRLVDPCVTDLFDRAVCLLEDAKSGVHLRGK